MNQRFGGFDGLAKTRTDEDFYGVVGTGLWRPTFSDAPVGSGKGRLGWSAACKTYLLWEWMPEVLKGGAHCVNESEEPFFTSGHTFAY